MSSGRLQAFSDGVLAIVITLLILDIKVPVDAHGHLGRDLADQWPQYAACLSAFLVVVIIWLNHHATLQLLARTDHRNQVLNLLPLLPVSLLPWPTAVPAEYARDVTLADQRVAVLLLRRDQQRHNAHLHRPVALPAAVPGPHAGPRAGLPAADT